MIKKKVTLEWLKELIRSGDTSPFYNTKDWNLIREKKEKQNIMSANAAAEKESIRVEQLFTIKSI